MKKILHLFLAITAACSSGDDSSIDDTNQPINCDVVYLDANGVTIKACPDAQIGQSGNVNGFTYTIVSEQQLRDFVEDNYPDLNRLVTSQVTNMSFLFNAKSYINPAIGNWDVSNVTNMEGLFRYAYEFNQNIGNWDVSNVVNMASMFRDAYSFNQDIGNWNVSKVTSMIRMFDGSGSFNKDISRWDVSNVERMYRMFFWAWNFNQDLSIWNVDNVIGCDEFSLNTENWTLPKPNFTNCFP